MMAGRMAGAWSSVAKQYPTLAKLDPTLVAAMVDDYEELVKFWLESPSASSKFVEEGGGKRYERHDRPSADPLIHGIVPHAPV